MKPYERPNIEIKPLPGTTVYKEIEHPGGASSHAIYLLLLSQIVLWAIVLRVLT